MTSNLDIVPTILDYTGVPAAPAVLGRSLRPLIENPTATSSGIVFADLYHLQHFESFKGKYREGLGDAYLRAMVKDQLKLIKSTDYKSGGTKIESYDLGIDPGEKDNLALAGPGKSEADVEQMEAFFNNLPFAITPDEAAKVPKEMINLLKSIGYLR
jgi:arylsulfatase A-like enzyme